MTPAPLLLLLALLAPALAAAQPQACPQLFVAGAAPRLVNPKLAQGTVMLCSDSFAVVASSLTRGALWSAEHPTAASLDAAREMSRRDAFHADGRLPAGARGELEDYRGSGFDRGHMTPSGDMPDSRAQRQTFSLANMVPQTPELNRGPWEGIESAVRQLAERQGELYVVTGPAFQGGHISAIGPGGVLVPTSTWKAVYDPVARGAGAYFCSNTDHPVCDTITIARLATTVGIDPFPAVPAAVKAQLLPLPPPESSRYAGARETRRPVQSRGLLDRLLHSYGLLP